MKKIDLGQTVTLLANVGVIVGIIFLAFELRQNNQQLALQSYQSWVDANLAINASLMNQQVSAIAAAGNSGSANLTEDTFITYAMWQLSVFQMAQSTDYLHRQGALDEELWRAEMNRAAGILSLPGVRQWWDAGGRTQVSPGFADYIESVQSDIAIWDWRPEEGFFRNDGLEIPR